MDIEKAKIEWKKLSSMDKRDYGSFEKYYESMDWSRSGSASDDTNSVASFLVGLLIFIPLVFFIFPKGCTKVSNFFDDRSQRKAFCAEETSNVKNEFTAKKLYKACMNR